MSLLVNPQLLLSCLERFENQAHNVISDDQSIELFCKEVIPFLEENPTIDALRQHWKEHRTYLNQQVEDTSTQALLETNDSFKEISLNDLFPHPNQKEFLRSYCENFFKYHGDCGYFQGADPLYDHLDQELIKTFVVDHESLIVVFQPYTVGGCADVPFTVKIPFTECIGKWQAGNPLEKHLPITKNFLSSWDKDNWISDVQEDHSIAYRKDSL